MRRLTAALLLTACISTAGAVNSADIAAQIDKAEQGRQAAHALAEAAREMGETDNHHTIQYAKGKWAEYTAEIGKLQAQYQAAKEAERVHYGRFKITFYCPCAGCNGTANGLAANGARLEVGKTIAVDPKVIPLGSRVYIDGIGWRVAQDTGSAIKGRRIDVLVGSHAEAYRMGIRNAEVWK